MDRKDSLGGDSVPSVEERRKKLGSVLRDCRRLVHSLAPAVVIPPLLLISGGDLVLPGSKLSLFLVAFLFSSLCVYSTDGTTIVKTFGSLSYTALLSFLAGRIVSHVLSVLILYLDVLLAGFFFGIALAQRRRAIAVANTLSLDHTARFIWFATPSLMLLSSTVPKSEIVAGPVLWLCLVLYSTFVGFRLGLEIILTLSRLRVEAFSVFLAYRIRFHAYYDPTYIARIKHRNRYRETLNRAREEARRLERRGTSAHAPREQFSDLNLRPVTVTVRGDRRSLSVLSFVLAVAALVLLCCSGGELVASTQTSSLFIVLHLFSCIVYYSTEATPLAPIFFLLSYTWLFAFFAGALLTDLLGMVVMHLDSLLAAAVFGVTLAQHRQRNGTETAMDLAFAISSVHMEKNRQDIYFIMGFMTLCYTPILGWLVLVDSPAVAVAVSLFGATAFLQTIHITSVVSWLNGAVCTGDISVRVILYFGCAAMLFFNAYLVFGELAGITILWHCLLASTAYLGYYFQVHASYEDILSGRALPNAAVTAEM